MSGPIGGADGSVVADGQADAAGGPVLEIGASRASQVGALTVRRALPRRERRTVGAWCFVDHMGPVSVTRDHGVDIGPHPHLGLHTVTWLLDGEILHRDSLGSEQVIRPGQLNLMTAGHGVVHAEEATGRYAGRLHGVQLWVAQPQAERDGSPGFEHHPELPRVELGDTSAGAVATVLVGELAGAVSPARHDTELVGADLELRSPATTIPLRADFEHAVVVLDGRVRIDGRSVAPGQLAYLGIGRQELVVADDAGGSRVLLIGGVPFEERLVMWWNFVARSQDEITVAQREWMAGDPRFGPVASPLPRIPVGPPPWASSASR